MKIFGQIASIMILVLCSVFVNKIVGEQKPVHFDIPEIVVIDESPKFSVDYAVERAHKFNKLETNVELFEQECLALVMYYEARSQGLRSMLAVAFVIENRRLLDTTKTYCQIISDKHQFQTIKKLKPFRINNDPLEWSVYRDAIMLASILISNKGFKLYDSPIGDALYFHSLDKYEDWKYAGSHRYIKTIGKLHFSK